MAHTFYSVTNRCLMSNHVNCYFLCTLKKHLFDWCIKIHLHFIYEHEYFKVRYLFFSLNSNPLWKKIADNILEYQKGRLLFQRLTVQDLRKKYSIYSSLAAKCVDESKVFKFDWSSCYSEYDIRKVIKLSVLFFC